MGNGRGRDVPLADGLSAAVAGSAAEGAAGLQRWIAAVRSGSRMYWLVQAISAIGSVLLSVQLLAVAAQLGQQEAVSGGVAIAVAMTEACLLLLMTHLVVRPTLLAVFVGRQTRLRDWCGLGALLAVCASIATMLANQLGLISLEPRHIQEVRFNTGASEFSVAFSGWQLFAMQSLNTFFAYAIWTAVYLLWKAVETRRQLQHQVRHARMWQLTRQMGPHFLFNTFNSIRGLVYADQERAARMITQLSALLRYQMDLDQRTHQSLEAECAVARDYLEIEAARLEPRLRFEFDVDEALLDRELPALTVLTAVENAVKHGIAPNAHPGWVRVIVRASVHGWLLEVINSCGEPNTSPSTGIGLRNLRERLALDSNGRVVVGHWKEDATFHLRIEMPRDDQRPSR